MTRVRVYYPDGVFRGGFLTVEKYNRVRHRMWDGPPHPHYTETLIDNEGGSWYLLQISKSPQYDRPETNIDAFDSESRALCFSDREAMSWFEQQGIAPPANLVERVGRPKKQVTRSSEPEAPPRPRQSREEKRYARLAQALLTVKSHPDLSNAEIARRVGVSPSTLSRSSEFQLAARLARGADKDTFSKGFRLNDGGVEAEEGSDNEEF
jgi:hypothetical protein